MNASSNRTLVMFGELSGFEDATRVVIVTTMWDTLKDKTDAKEREAAFKSQYWDALINHGATVGRFLGKVEQDSTWSIINAVIDKDTERTALQFQHERVDQKKPLQQTSANMALVVPLPTLFTVAAKQRAQEPTAQDSASTSTPDRWVNSFH